MGPEQTDQTKDSGKWQRKDKSERKRKKERKKGRSWKMRRDKRWVSVGERDSGPSEDKLANRLPAMNFPELQLNI